MDLQEEFSNLTTKFLFLNCDNGSYENIKGELNVLLNDLNSLDYQKQKFVDHMTGVRLLNSLTNIPSHEDTLIVKACCLIVMIINKQKVQLPPDSFKSSIDWLLKSLNFNFYSIASDILSAMQALFRNHPQYCKENWDILLSPDGLLLNLLNKSSHYKKNLSENYDAISSEEISLSAMFCIEALLSNFNKYAEEDKFGKMSIIIGTKLIDNLYTNKLKFENNSHKVLFYTSALNSLHTILVRCKGWFEQNIGEVLGISQSFMFYGLPDSVEIEPQKVLVSQQSVFEPVSIPESKGGKVAKTRKPRTISKNKNKKSDKNKTSKTEDKSKEKNGIGNSLHAEFDNLFLSPFNKTSDSDFSESETGRSQNERHKEAKLRLAAISLIGLTAKTIEKRIMYGYWHSIFPSESTCTYNGLLCCILKDPNPRCRIAALQAASLFFFGSKPFLIQAENCEKAPTSFMPFSIALGNMIRTMYDTLTQALSSENSLPVLTQILKCLTVLIQATPFHRLSKGFVTNFVKYIRRLVYHRDPTIQVAALMVMEFLISVQEMTTEISDCVGIPEKTAIKNKNQNQLNDTGIYEFIESKQEEELVDSDYEDNVDGDISDVATDEYQFQVPKMSWLLQRILENLGIPVGALKQKAIIISTTPVRIESLQALSSIAPHFSLLKHHLNLVSSALQISLDDQLPEIRLYAGKCLDVIGHSINTYLLEKGSNINEDLVICQNFWTSILPHVMQKIQDHKQNSGLKAVLCDFLSNIGVHVFETLSHNVHIQLISLLSGIGCNELNTTRAAAVRALAVYTLFPSLREDLCFIENTAEYIIQLMKEPNLYVKIKASWSMGNVSDALIANSAESQLDRISNDLLKRMLETAIRAAGDNDKIKSNAVRTIGNLLRLVTGDLFIVSSELRTLSISAIYKLVYNVTTGGNAKVKWNSCYAIGNFLQNQTLFTNKHWQGDVFSALCDLIIDSSNFKVRINGAIALTAPKERSNYGIHMEKVWASLLSALEQSDNLVDFNEYKHRDNLQEQLCLSLTHVIKIAAPDDYIMLKNELIPKLESTKQNWTRVMNRVLPENAAPLLGCCIHLNDLLKNNCLTIEQRNSIQILASCFVPPHEYI